MRSGPSLSTATSADHCDNVSSPTFCWRSTRLSRAIVVRNRAAASACARVGGVVIARLPLDHRTGRQNRAVGPLVVTRQLVIPAHELTWRFSRSSGPGGQSVNTSDTRVELSYDVAGSDALSDLHRARAVQRLGDRLIDGVLTVTASEHRSQLRNREAALARLAETLRDAIAPPAAPRRPTRPTRAAREKRLSSKRRRGDIKRLRRTTDDG
ncbi:MAG: aminoacyl-tRNA hydrolase [Frankiales bacterium]|nr:aminoacyl-tRNA hydrolase [Frankiales bacterium]